jgi:ribosomal-protein-alanine N-acetyltransferase
MSVIVQTDRIIIREFLPEEQEIHLTHFTDERVTLYLPNRSREERITIFQDALKQYAVTQTMGIWGMFNKADNDFIGCCLLRPFNNDPATAELGYSLEHKYWGRGIGTEMATAVIAHGLTDNTISEIVAVTALENLASQRVLEKAGLMRADNFIKDGLELAFFRQKVAHK